MHVTFDDVGFHKETKCNDKKVIGTHRLSTLTLLEEHNLILEDNHTEEKEDNIFKICWDMFIQFITRACF